MEIILDERSKAYGDIDDGVTPSVLVCKEGMGGKIAGVQVHAVSGAYKPEPVSLQGNKCGRILELPNQKYQRQYRDRTE